MKNIRQSMKNIRQSIRKQWHDDDNGWKLTIRAVPFGVTCYFMSELPSDQRAPLFIMGFGVISWWIGPAIYRAYTRGDFDKRDGIR